MNFNLSSYIDKAQREELNIEDMIVSLPTESFAAMDGIDFNDKMAGSIIEAIACLESIYAEHADKEIPEVTVQEVLDKVNAHLSGVEFTMESFNIPETPSMISGKRVLVHIKQFVEKLVLVLRQLFATMYDFVLNLTNSAERHSKILVKLLDEGFSEDNAIRFLTQLTTGNDVDPIIQITYKNIDLFGPEITDRGVKERMEAMEDFIKGYDVSNRLKAAAGLIEAMGEKIMETAETVSGTGTGLATLEARSPIVSADDVIERFVSITGDDWPTSSPSRWMGRSAVYRSLTTFGTNSKGFVVITTPGKQSVSMSIETVVPGIDLQYKLSFRPDSNFVRACAQTSLKIYSQMTGDNKKAMKSFNDGLEATLSDLPEKALKKGKEVAPTNLTEVARAGRFMLNYFRVEQQYMYRFARALATFAINSRRTL